MADIVQMLRAATRLAQQGDHEQAAEKFLAVVAIAEKDPRGWFGAGVCLARAGDKKEAREALETAQRLGHPKAREVLEKLAAREAKKAQPGGAEPDTPEAPQPAAAPPEPAPAQKPAVTAAKIDLGKHVRIMLIEDKPRDRQAITEALSESIEGVEIVHSPFAESASRTIVGMGIFDVAILDWNTSPRAAKELLDFLKLKQPHIPVVVLTQAWSEEMANDAIRAGADYCMVKASGYARILPSVIEQRFKQSFALQEKLVNEMADPAHGWRRYFDPIDRPALLLGPDGEVVDVNLAAVALLHEPRDRLAGRSCEELFGHTPEVQSFFPLAEAFAAGEPVTVERGEPDRGTRFRVSVQRTADDDQVQYVATLEDLSDEPAGGGRLAAALDQSDQQVFYVDGEGRFLYANAALAGSLGCSPDDLVGRTEAEVKPGDEADRRMAVLRDVLDRREATSTEENRAGRWYSYRLTPVTDGDNVVGVIGMGRDTTDRRRRESQAGATILGKLADLSDDMAFELDPQGVVTFINSSAGKACGRAPSEIVGRPFEGLVDEAAREQWRGLLKRVVEGGESIGHQELPLRRPDGSAFHGEFSLTAAADPDTGAVAGVRGMVRDVSARKRLETAIGLLRGDIPLA